MDKKDEWNISYRVWRVEYLMDDTIPIFAHRGASARALENTMNAFNKAKELGATGIELDVQCTKDGVLVVFHDLNLYRLAGITKLITECTAEELSKYPLGKNVVKRRFSPQYIPTLEQVVEWAQFNQMPLNIELKESLLKCRQPLIDMLLKLTLPKGSHFSSFHEELLKIVKMQRPDFQTALLVTKSFDWEQLKTMTYIDAVNANKRYYKPQYLQASQVAQKGIRFYSINGKESFLLDPHPNVIGWITDYPDRVRKIQNKKKK